MEISIDYSLSDVKRSEHNTPFVRYIKGLDGKHVPHKHDMYRHLKLHPVNFVLNNRYVYFVLSRFHSIIECINSLRVLDEKYNDIPIKSTFLAINYYYKFNESENNLSKDLNLPLGLIPFTGTYVYIDMGEDRDDTKVPVYIFSDMTVSDRYITRECRNDTKWKGFDLSAGWIPQDEKRFSLIDNSNLITLWSPSGKYNLSYSTFRNINRHSETPVKIVFNSSLTVEGKMKDLDIIPTACFTVVELFTDVPLNLEILTTSPKNGDVYNVLGKEVQVCDGMIIEKNIKSYGQSIDKCSEECKA